MNLPVFWVSNGINDGVMDDRSFGNHSWYGVHEGCQDVGIPRVMQMHSIFSIEFYVVYAVIH